MKKLFILLSAALLVVLAGCEEKVINTTNPLTEDPTATCEILNANVDALHAIIEAMENNIAITQNVASNLQHSITFSNNRLAHIYLDTSTNALPFIYAKKENGVYYWYYNGVWLLDANQNRVEVLKNKLSFKIIDGYWLISFDNKKYENYGAVRGNECIRFFKSLKTEAKATTFILSNQHKYEYRWYDENEIRFEDPTVEKICIDNWDTNHDMALSYDEAAVVTYIGNVFRGKSIVSFDELQYFVGLQTIGSEAFSRCSSLTSITIPNSVTSIDVFAFYRCSSLTSITLPNGVTSIDVYAFSECSSLTSINIPDSVTSIGREAFSGCSSLTSITIPNSVTSIGENAFSSCSSLTSITIPNSVTSIESGAFYNCSSLKEFKGKFASTDSRCLIVNNSLIAFAPAGLTEYAIPNSVTSIDNYAFSYCSSLTSINIPNSVTSIGSYTFEDCSSLTSITIPNSVTSIGRGAFVGCWKLTSIYCTSSTPPTGSSNMFNSNATGRKIYVPKAAVNTYKTAAYWSSYANDIVGYDF